MAAEAWINGLAKRKCRPDAGRAIVRAWDVEDWCKFVRRKWQWRMVSKYNSALGRFRLVSDLEGWSFLVLMGIAMPLKYIWDFPAMVQVVGMAHGVLFLLYLLMVALYRTKLKWNAWKTLLAAGLSFVPFGTFYVTRKMII